MGQSHSDIENQDLFKLFKRQEWKRQKELGFYELWQNIKTGQLCQAYKLDFVPKQQQLQHYRFRHYNQNADNFVQIRYVDIQKNSTLCNHGESYVLTEFIPVKLVQMNNLTHLEGYSLLRATYRAFHTMQAFHSPFIPDQTLIGVNLNGKPKIWLNKDHSKNKASNIIQAQIWQKHLGQVSQNVKRILQMLQQKLIDKKFPRQFRQYFYNNIMNFSQAGQYVQDYCQKHKISIPHKINYLRFIQNSQLLQIINKYQSKRLNTLSDRLNTLDSAQEPFILSHSQNPLLRRTQSHKTFTNYHQNVFINQPHKQRYMIENQRGNNTVSFTIYPRPRTQFYSPVIQRVRTTPILEINPTLKKESSSNLNVNHISYINTKQNIRPPQIYQQIPRLVQVRRIQHSIPSFLKRQDNLNNKFASAVDTIPLHQTKLISKRQIQGFNNLRTPQHIANNIQIAHPVNITSFQEANRNVKVSNNESQNYKQKDISSFDNVNKQQIIPNKTYSQKQESQSIHEKILEFQNEDIKQSTQLMPQNNLGFRNNQNQTEQQQFNMYINNNEDLQNSRRIKQSFQQHSSQPDWENIQGQHLIAQSFNPSNYQQFQYQSDQRHQSHQNVNNLNSQGLQINQQNEFRDQQEQNQKRLYQSQQSQKQISPIKSSNEYQQGFINHHYNMFSKYAKLGKQATDQNYQVNQLDNNERILQSYNIEQGEYEEQIKKNVNNKLFSQNQPYELSKFQNSKTPLESPDLQSSQRIRHLSSKNTSINKGPLGGQSCGTLVIHESKQNIYQDLHPEERPMKVFISNIRQQSHQSQPQDSQPYHTRNQNFYNEQEGLQNKSQVYNYGSPQEQNFYREKQHFKNRQYYDQHQQFVNKSQDHYQEAEQQITITKQNNHQIPTNINNININQYENLHFRNQSNDLYQYTPVQSIYNQDNYVKKQPDLYHNQMFQIKGSEVQQIVKLQSHEDIQEYIRKKYSGMLNAQEGRTNINQYQHHHQETQPINKVHKQHHVNRAMTFAKPSFQSVYEQNANQPSIHHYNMENQIQVNQQFTLSKKKQNIQRIQSKVYQITQIRDTPELNKKITSNHQSNTDEVDFLDVRHLQKSLDKRYNKSSDVLQHESPRSPKFSSPQNQVKHSQTMSEDDGMNVAALQKKLLKFQERQSIERQKSQRKLQTIQDDSLHHPNDTLNFHQLDNIVQLMDKKIQQSQKKQQQNNSSRRQKQEQPVSSFQQKEKDPLGNVQLQASISNKQIGLNNIPILRQQHISNASNSNPASTRQNYYKFGMDSQDFATGRDKRQYGLNSSIKRQQYHYNKPKQYSNNYNYYDQKFSTNLSPVYQLDRKYQNYSSKNYSTAINDYKIDLNPAITNQYRRKSSKRSTRNQEDLKKYTNQIQNKWDKYLSSTKENSSQYSNQISKPFSKKNYYDSNYQESKTIQPVSYQSYSSRKNNSMMQKKRSSYLNTITELQGQYNPSPYKEEYSKINNNGQTNYEYGQQNYLNLSNKNSKKQLLSNRNSNNASKSNINLDQTSKRTSSAKITYDQLRQLLWK